MIAACAYRRLLSGERSGWDLEVHPNLPMARPLTS